MTQREAPMTIAARWGLVALASLLAGPAFAQATTGAASGGDGQLMFNNACRTCHTVKEGDNRLGPNLHNVVGRKAGSLPDYNNYSSSMKNAGLTWDKATLDRFIANPDAVVPGHNMKPFGGLANADERAKIVSYLETAGR
jgi:cytochrome c